jgi:hypothetical protein
VSIVRYHPAIVGQQAAHRGLPRVQPPKLSVGAGERLIEHIVGRGWSAVDVRHDVW